MRKIERFITFHDRLPKEFELFCYLNKLKNKKKLLDRLWC